MRVAPAIVLTEEERNYLRKQRDSAVASQRLAERARIVLLAADGLRNEQIAAEVGCTEEKAGRWRSRFAANRLEGIKSDKPGRGRKRSYTTAVRNKVVNETLNALPPNATHWSRSSLAAVTGISASTIGRIWRENGLKPHLTKSFKLSNDPHFVEKLETISGLYLNAPEHALVLCCDEKSQIQALDRTQPGLPLKKGRAGTMTHDYVRHGTTTLFAALNAADGTMIAQCHDRHRHQEWLKFLKHIERETPPEKQLHLIVDNYATHKHARVKAWLSRHPRIHVHFTPTGASWMNMVERFFRDLTQNRIRRGVFVSVEHLVEELEAYIREYNKTPTPFVWTAKATDILAKVNRARKAYAKADTLR